MSVSYLVRAVIATVAFAANAHGEGLLDTLRHGTKELTLEVENDSFLTTDRYYTNALRVRYAAGERALHAVIDGNHHLLTEDNTSEWLSGLPIAQDKEVIDSCREEVGAPCLAKLATRIPGLKAWSDTYGMQIASNMYTGKDIRLSPSDVPHDDQPYAGWSYVGIFRQRTSFDDSELFSELDIGCIGPCAKADQIQKWWHDRSFVDAPPPQGWPAQIGTEPAVQAILIKRFRTLSRCGDGPCNSEENRYFDFAAFQTAQLGNVFLTAGAGGIARVGLYRMRGYFEGHGVRPSLPKFTLRTTDIGESATNGQPTHKTAQTEVFLYARGEIKAVAYNALIEGRMFGGPDPFTQDVRRVVADLELGLAAHFKYLSVTTTYATRSTEIRAQPSEPFHHRWLQVRVEIPFGSR